jgi:hypothetical protein
MGIKRIVTETQKCFGMETNATRFDKMKRAKREFQMRNDTEGASFAALFATIQVCAVEMYVRRYCIYECNASRYSI